MNIKNELRAMRERWKSSGTPEYLALVSQVDLGRMLDLTEALMELVDDKDDYARALWAKPHDGSDVAEASAIREMVRQIRELADDALGGK